MIKKKYCDKNIIWYHFKTNYWILIFFSIINIIFLSLMLRPNSDIRNHTSYILNGLPFYLFVIIIIEFSLLINRIFAYEIHNGHLAFFLLSNNNRNTIFLSKVLFILLYTLVQFTLIMAIESFIILSDQTISFLAVFTELINIFILNLLILSFIVMISIFCENFWIAITLSLVLLATMYLCYVIGMIAHGSVMKSFRYLSLFSLVQASFYDNFTSATWINIPCSFLGIIGLFLLNQRAFKKKNLNL